MNGHVTVNGRSRDLRLFRRQVAYIMQEDVLQKHITVWEAMYFSASLKIGNHMTKADKINRVSLAYTQQIGENSQHIHSELYSFNFR